MTLESQWLEVDYNPFILFDREGRVKNLNTEAQYLLGDVSNKEIYDLALSYASHDYGFKTTMIDLDFRSYTFYGITVGYQDEEHIGIKLYRTPAKHFANINTKGERTNLYSILDMCISADATSSTTTYVKEFDPTFPDMILNVTQYVKVLSYFLKLVSTQEVTTIGLYLKTGEYLKVEDKKYQIFVISFSHKAQNIHIDPRIEEICNAINCTITQKDHHVLINSPMAY